MTGSTFSSWEGMNLEIDPANRVFRFDEDFIVNCERHTLVRYLGTSEDVFIGKEFEAIDAGCFDTRDDITRVTIETGSRISVLGVGGFSFYYR
jgi:hypothetical protein